MMPVTPAAVAVARAATEPGPQAPALPERASITGRLPAVALARGAAIAVVIALFGAAVLALGLGLSAIAYLVHGSATAEPSAPPLDPLGPGVTFESATPGLRIFLGARELGGAPLHLTPDDLTGEPVIALAPGHQPTVLRAERMVELTRAVGRVHRLDLEPSRHPDQMVYVRYDGQGTAHLVAGDEIGDVPGVVRVPIARDEPVPTAITIFDESGQTSVTLSLENCEPSHVCLLHAGSGS